MLVILELSEHGNYYYVVTFEGSICEIEGCVDAAAIAGLSLLSICYSTESTGTQRKCSGFGVSKYLDITGRKFDTGS